MPRPEVMPRNRGGLRHPERLYSPEELAFYLGVPVATVYRWNYVKTGPRFSRVGRHIRYRASDVDAWLEAHAEA